MAQQAPSSHIQEGLQDFLVAPDLFLAGPPLCPGTDELLVVVGRAGSVDPASTGLRAPSDNLYRRQMLPFPEAWLPPLDLCAAARGRVRLEPFFDQKDSQMGAGHISSFEGLGLNAYAESKASSCLDVLCAHGANESARLWPVFSHCTAGTAAFHLCLL